MQNKKGNYQSFNKIRDIPQAPCGAQKRTKKTKNEEAGLVREDNKGNKIEKKRKKNNKSTYLAIIERF